MRRLAEAIRAATTRPGTSWRSAAARRTPSSASRLDQMLPPEITLIHGPGCPVCVTPIEHDRQGRGHRRPAGRDLLLVRRHVAGARLAQGPVTVKSEGGDVRIVYSPMDAVALARKQPERRWCSSPSASRPRPRPTPWPWPRPPAGAGEFLRARVAVLVPPAMRAVLGSPANRVQGFLAAGHVCTIMGIDEYRPSPRSTACRSW